MRERSIPPRLYSSKNTIFIVAVLFRVLFRYVHPPKQGPRRIRPSFLYHCLRIRGGTGYGKRRCFRSFRYGSGLPGPRRNSRRFRVAAGGLVSGPDTGDLVCGLYRPSVVTGGLRSCLGYACSHRSPLFCKDTNKPSAKAILFAFCRGGVSKTKSKIRKDGH